MSEPEDTSREPLARPIRIVLFGLALVLLFFTKDSADSWADGSRLGTIQALVEHGTLALDDTDFFWHGDKVLIGGHYYSHQPPMLALLGAIPYGILHHVFGRGISDPFTYRILTWCLVGLPLWLGFLALARVLRATNCGATWIAILIGLAALGTLALPYSLVLQQHGTAAGLVLLAFAAAHRRRPLLAGALLASATTIDLTAVFPAIFCAWPLFRTGGAAAVVRYGLGALPALALHFGINLSLAGDLLPVGLHLEAFDYPFSPWAIMSLTGGEHRAGSGLLYLFGATLGLSGYFSHHPITLFAIAAGIALLLRKRSESDRPFSPGLLPAATFSILAISTYYLTQSRNFGGSSFGMRWFTVFSPLLTLFPAVYLGRRERALGTGTKIALVIAGLWSVCAASLGSVQPWAKFRYFFYQRPDALVAAPGHVPPDWPEHLKREWVRVSTMSEDFDERSWKLWFEDHVHRAGKLYSMRFDQFTEEEQAAWHREGLSKLQKVIDHLVRINDLSGSRVVGHYWLGKLHHLLGDRAAAGREYDRCLDMHSGYGPAIKGRQKLRAERGQ